MVIPQGSRPHEQVLMSRNGVLSLVFVAASRSRFTSPLTRAAGLAPSLARLVGKKGP
jgi:hypothetical protein